MARVAQANLDLNGVVGGRIEWGAVVPDHFAESHVAFTLRRSFWASSLTPPEDARNTREVQVPALRLGPLLARFCPTVLCVDVEGENWSCSMPRYPPTCGCW